VKTLAYLATLIATTLSLAGAAQEQAPEPDTRPGVVKDYGDFDLDQWVYDEKRVAVGWSEKFPNANELVQTRGMGTAAYPRDLQFRDGAIECDMAGGAYLGISFRIREVDGERLSEDVYFRISGNQRPQTVQYYPHGTLKQEELHRPPYERPIRLIEQDEWFHVRIEVQGRQARVFLDDSRDPVQVIEDLMHDHADGSVGVRSWGGRFANLKVTLTEPADNPAR
jgi:hypothetical protein